MTLILKFEEAFDECKMSAPSVHPSSNTRYTLTGNYISSSLCVSRRFIETNFQVRSIRHAPQMCAHKKYSRGTDEKIELKYESQPHVDGCKKFMFIKGISKNSPMEINMSSSVSGYLPGGGHGNNPNQTYHPNVTARLYNLPCSWGVDSVDRVLSHLDSSSTSTLNIGGSLLPAFRVIRLLQNNWSTHTDLFTLLTQRVPSLFRNILLLGETRTFLEGESQTEKNRVISDESSLDDSDDYSDYSGHAQSAESSSSGVVKHLEESYNGPLSAADVDEDFSNGLQALLDLLESRADSPYAPERLDYVITQTDISRMARNASKHLDVASILSLPTITYRSPPPKTVTITKEQSCLNEKSVRYEGSHIITEGDEANSRTSPNEVMWSWMMISRDGQAAVTYPETDYSHPDDFQGEDQQPLELNDQQDCCVICLENFGDGDKLRVLPCSHLFHTGCIDHWLLGTYSDFECETSGCPMCKKRATSLAEEVFSPDGSVPAWAFAQLGDALAKQESVRSSRTSEDHIHLHQANFLNDECSSDSLDSLSS